MFIFSLKKSFYDAWDNFIGFILTNFALLFVILAGLWPVYWLMENRGVTGMLALAIFLLILGIALGAVSRLMSDMADYHPPKWGNVSRSVRTTWRASLAFSLLLMGTAVISTLGMNYYLTIKNFFGIAAWALLFWMGFGFYLTAIWFFAVRSRMNDGVFKSLKKSLLIMLDNFLLSLFIGFIMIPLQFILWPLTAFAAFGPAGILLYINAAMKLLMHKYDWMAEHPDAKHGDIPWQKLLMEDRERVGTRTLKGMIFPWKE